MTSQPTPTGPSSARPETATEAAWTAIYRTIVRRLAIFTAVVLVASAGLGYLLAGLPGLYGALLGTALCAVFSGVTVGSMYAVRNRSLQLVAGVLGVGFFIKAFLFLVVATRLAQIEGINGMAVFFTVVVAVIGTSLIEAITVQKGRVPYVDPEAR